jgi:integral membrane protein
VIRVYICEMKSETGTYASLKRFSGVALAEGVSFVLLMFVAMPLKYLADMPAAVKYTGWAHGILFIAYFIFLAEVKSTAKWNLKKTALAALASLLPFGTFVLDKKIIKPEMEALK